MRAVVSRRLAGCVPYALLPIVALLQGCGGGSSAQAPTTPRASALQGTVAVGAPMTDATITVMDANGTTATATVLADGSYSGLSLDGMTAPYRIQACGFVDGGRTCYYAVAQDAGTANVTPLTQATVSLALGADASTLFDGTAAPSAQDLADQQAKLATALQPVLAAVGVDGATLDFTTSAFTADRTGLDKLLDALKINVGTNGTGSAFVQVEGNLAAGNVYMDSSGGSSGSLQASGAGVDLTGIDTVFEGLSHGVAQAGIEACTGTMQAAHLFDPAFSMRIDGGQGLDASNAAQGLCTAVGQMGLLGAAVANPVLNDCDTSAANGDKVCVIHFDIIDVATQEAFSGAQLAIVQHAASTAWALLGDESDYAVNVNADAQRRMRIDLDPITATYTRAISFDIASSSNDGGQDVASALVYQHSVDGIGWDSTPIATLGVPANCNEPRLTIQGSSCGSTWMSVDGWGQAGADGDTLIDNFYKRGRKVRIDLFADAGATQKIATLYKRVDGVPPKSDALPGQPWPAIDAASQAGLVALDGAATTYSFSWTSDPSVELHDASFCLSGGCQGGSHAVVTHGGTGAGHIDMTLQGPPAGAGSFKELALFGRSRDGLGLQSNYVTCGQQADQDCN